MAFEPTIQPTAYTQTYSYVPVGGGATFNYSISAVTTLNNATLSGVNSVVVMTLSGTTVSTGASALSAASDRIFLRFGSTTGNQDVYGFVSASTLVPGASTLTFTVEFNDQNFYSTAIAISGNATTSILLTGTGLFQIDNPFYTVPNVTATTGGLSSVNLGFVTVAEHCRRFQQIRG